MQAKQYEQTFNDGLVTVYASTDGTINPDSLEDLTKIADLRYGESTISELDSTITEGHEISESLKVKTPDCKLVEAGMFAVAQDYRTGKKKLFYIYHVSPNRSIGTIFLFMQEVRHEFN